MPVSLTGSSPRCDAALTHSWSPGNQGSPETLSSQLRRFRHLRRACRGAGATRWSSYVPESGSVLTRPHLPQFGEGAAALAQPLGRPDLHDPPVLHDRDLVSHGHLGQPVGDQQGRPSPDDLDGGPVEGSRARASGLGRCLIQDDDLGVGQQGPCQRHLLGIGPGRAGFPVVPPECRHRRPDSSPTRHQPVPEPP